MIAPPPSLAGQTERGCNGIDHIGGGETPPPIPPRGAGVRCAGARVGAREASYRLTGLAEGTARAREVVYSA